MMDWSAVASALGAINIVILGFIVTRLSKLDDRINNSQSKADCIEARKACQKVATNRDDRQCEDMREIWDAFGKHSHTGLPADAKVTR